MSYGNLNLSHKKKKGIFPYDTDSFHEFAQAIFLLFKTGFSGRSGWHPKLISGLGVSVEPGGS